MIETEVKVSKYMSKGRSYSKKLIAAKQGDLPEPGTPIIIMTQEEFKSLGSNSKLQKAFSILNSLFLTAISEKNHAVISFLKSHLTKEQIQLLKEVEKL